MNLNKLKDEIQNKAVDKWIANDYKGLVLLPPGFGKNILALKALSKLPKGTRLVFLAETTQRKIDFFKEIEVYEKYFNSLEDYMIEFATYQAAYRWSCKILDFIVADEVDVIGESYAKVFENNEYKYVLGLSGTTSDHIEYDGKSKLELITNHMPLVYSYDIKQGVEDGLSRKLNVYIIKHKLDTINKVIKGGTKKKPFKTTEFAQHQYLTKAIKQAMFIKEPTRTIVMRARGGARSKLLYTLPSKIKIVKQLLKTITGKTIIFNNDLDTLYDLTPTLSSRNTPKENDDIRQQFEDGDIDAIGAFKLMQRGSNVSGLTNIILMSYFGNETAITQMIGRLRKDGTKIGNVFVIVTEDSQELKWFNKIYDVFEQYDKFEGPLDEILTMYKDN